MAKTKSGRKWGRDINVNTIIYIQILGCIHSVTQDAGIIEIQEGKTWQGEQIFVLRYT